MMTLDEREAVLRRYAAGMLGTRETIELIGARDYADLIIAMAHADLKFPKPADTPRRAADLARAREILLPLLRRGD
jgi:hypothetical protein